MKDGITLSTLAQEVERQEQAKKDYIADTRDMEVIPTAEPDAPTELALRLGGDGTVPPLSITDHAHRQLGDRLKVPARFYDRLRQDHPDLLASTVTELMHREPAKRMVRTLDGKARAFLSDRYRPLDNYELLSAVLPIFQELGDGLQVKSCAVTETKLYLKAVFPRIEREVKQGDTVQSGVVISNSEVGNGALTVTPMVYRLVCLNGMIAGKFGQRRNHVGRAAEADDAFEVFRDETLQADDRAFFLKVQDTVRAAAQEAHFETIVAEMAEATERRIEGDVPRVIETVKKQMAFTDGEANGIMRHLIEGGDLSQYGLLNAVTRTSQDVEDYDRATELERAGGRILELSPRDWKVIAEAA